MLKLSVTTPGWADPVAYKSERMTLLVPLISMLISNDLAGQYLGMVVGHGRWFICLGVCRYKLRQDLPRVIVRI